MYTGHCRTLAIRSNGILIHTKERDGPYCAISDNESLSMTLNKTGDESQKSFLQYKPRSCAQFAPGCMFGHVNGVLRICTRVH